MDQFGQIVGSGDVGCYDAEGNVDERYLRVCPGDSSYCVLDMEADWYTSGDQDIRIRRSCSAVPPSGGSTPGANGDYGVFCSEGRSDTGYQYKDCKQYWDASEDEGRNKNTEQVENSLGSGKVSSCHLCYSDSLVPDMRDQCQNVPAEANQTPCPKYATSGCYKSVSEHVEGSKISVEVWRGCSTFSMQEQGGENNKATCNGFRRNDVQYEVCKQTCEDGDNCNNKAPDVFAEPLKCFVCSETWNHLNQSIGHSDTGCFLKPDEKYLHECGPLDTMCSTQMEVDWTILGSQNTIIRRGCAQGSSEAVSCKEGDTLNLQYKQCTQNSRGFGSNDNFKIANEFASSNKQDNCYTCTHNSKDGADTYNCFAEEAEHTEDDLTWRDCGIWQNAACFTADNIHQEGAGLETEVHRGCSTFELPSTKCAHMDYEDDADYACCRQTCTGSHCNSEKYPTDENNCECPYEEL